MRELPSRRAYGASRIGLTRRRAFGKADGNVMLADMKEGA
jgi:hypothetical protein